MVTDSEAKRLEPNGGAPELDYEGFVRFLAYVGTRSVLDQNRTHEFPTQLEQVESVGILSHYMMTVLLCIGRGGVGMLGQRQGDV